MLARDYSTKRMSFGKFLADHPLHMRTLSNMEVINHTHFITTNITTPVYR